MTVLLVAADVVVTAAFWAFAWLEPSRGDAVFMWLVGIAAGGYVAALAALARSPRVAPGVMVLCLTLALAARAPLVAGPPGPASDAVRYIWDARVQRA